MTIRSNLIDMLKKILNRLNQFIISELYLVHIFFLSLFLVFLAFQQTKVNEHLSECQKFEYLISLKDIELNQLRMTSEILKTRLVIIENNSKSKKLKTDINNAYKKIEENESIAVRQNITRSKLNKDLQETCSDIQYLADEISLLQTISSIIIGLIGLLVGRGSRERKSG